MGRAMYYIMKCPIITTDAGEAVMEIHNTFRLAGIRLWHNSRPIPPEKKQNIPNPIEIDFDVFRGYEGPPREFRDIGIPVMSDRLYQVLVSCGVDNLEVFPVVLRNTSTEQKYKYYAYKIYDVAPLMDMTESEYETYRNTEPASIHKFVADESKAHGLLMFRMAESVTAIVVHESVKNAIQAAGIDTVKFINPEDYTSI